MSTSDSDSSVDKKKLSLDVKKESKKKGPLLSEDAAASDEPKAKKLKKDKKTSLDTLQSNSEKKSKFDEQEPSWLIGKRKRIKISEFKGQQRVDIREIYLDKDGTEKPGKKGINLGRSEFLELAAIIEEIKEWFDKNP